MTIGSTTLLTHSLDNRRYQFRQLNNGLRVLVVQDPSAEASAVAATVANGHFSDPADCLGLSHLLEHMLFQGNKKYPTVDAFDSFLSLHGGYVNAATGSEYSHYYFSITDKYLAPSLDHFAHLLTQPLFEITAIEKEIQAIDAEFSLKMNDDLRRLYEVHKETSNPEHPFSQFSVGNKTTLNQRSNKEVQRLLEVLHQKKYVSRNITLCVISTLDNQACLELIKQNFDDITDITPPVSAPLPLLYLPEQLGIRINITPLRAAKRLIVTFALPSVIKHYRTKPLSIISELLADEGSNGLLGYFKARGLATNISVGGGIEGSTFKDFNVNLQLTDLGLTEIDAMLESLFHYIHLIKNHSKKRFFSEKKALLLQEWKFADSVKATDEAIGLASAIFSYPEEHIVASEYLLDKPDDSVIDELLRYFSPINMRVKVVSPNAKTDRVSHWYKTPYAFSPITPTLIEKLLRPKGELSLILPDKNPFLSLDHSLVNHEASFTTLQQTIKSKDFNLWFGQDDQFGLPRGDCYVSFDCAEAMQGVEIATIKKLWIALLNSHFQQLYYQANVAGLNYHLYSHQCGFSLHTSGFSTKQLRFNQDLIEKIHSFDDFTKHFEQVKQQQWQSLHNNLLNKPINRLFNRLSALMQQNTHTPLSMVNIMQKTTIEQVHEAKHALLGKRHIESLVYGNWRANEANHFAKELQQKNADYIGHEKLSRSVSNLCEQDVLLHPLPCDHPDAAVVIYYQAPHANLRDTLLTILLEQLVSPIFFNFARQQAQLGYLVGSGYVPFNQHPGIAFYVQSPQYSAQYLIITIRNFLQKLAINLQPYQKNWQDMKRGVIKQLCGKDANLGMKSQRLWSAIGNQDYSFMQKQNTFDELSNLEFPDLMTFVNGLALGKNIGELILYSDQKHHIVPGDLGSILLDDIAAFKKHTPLVK
ncbi:insulinase family protein [Paraglaciecola sp. 20A4]|uniref:insulinase family protein n=1 Tax=Paraglaciecola sp. 20A4 TaxID=2687288 RepID=UPI00197DF37F|nr:insulinase family protein [Paraglaciecola sp. 20A4]